MKTALLAVCAFVFTYGHAKADWCNDPNDPSATFLCSVNEPIYGTLHKPEPSDPTNPQPDSGIKLNPNSSNMLSLVMGSGQTGANLTTDQDIFDHFFTNYIVGNLDAAIGSPQDTGQGGNNVFGAVARHYPVGDPNSVEVMQPDGLHLMARCSAAYGCVPGKVWAGLIRVPFRFVPGMTLEVRYKSPSNSWSWAPIWLFSGEQISPGPGGDPYAGFCTNQSLYQPPGQDNGCYKTGHYLTEIDMNDNYTHDYDFGVPVGHQLDFGAPNNYGAPYVIQPHYTYWADQNSYKYIPDGGATFDATPVDTTVGFHNLLISWSGQTHLLSEFLDGKLVVQMYLEYPHATYINRVDNKTVMRQAMHLLIGNQAIPSFHSGTPPTSLGPDSDIVVQRIRAWRGIVQNPMNYMGSPTNGCVTQGGC